MSEKKKTMERKETKAKPKKRPPIFYIGPTVRRGILEEGMAFRGGLPKEVEELKEKYPLTAPLFIEKKDYIGACQQLKIAESRMSIIYGKALESIRGGK
ncbi:hypothetical protein PM10SUCC1_28730 [Propionigenium maris DSM 9537]|uniref:Uncharacterized protein n=1 Tax=Propionigenium maris DSM 9537 TaxID=1123000 RepID=A0A9W6GP05_9FUSO|nr:hypothetical protein [Propionigenium maris]GLI57359.1 hypothetical protein PM10SUCC1_28730 [Propionigenium maris DSM 9537]